MRCLLHWASEFLSNSRTHLCDMLKLQDSKK